MEMYEQTESENAARKRVYKQSTTRVNKTLQNPFTINGRTYKNLSDFLGVNDCMVYTTVDGKGYGGTAFNAYNDDWPILVRKVTDNNGNTVQEFSAISPIGFNGKLMDTEMDSGMVSNNLKSGVTSEIILLPWSTDFDRINSTLKNNIKTLANAAEKNYQNTHMYAAGVGTIKDATGSTIKGASRQEAYVPRTTEEFEKYTETGVVPGGNTTPDNNNNGNWYNGYNPNVGGTNGTLADTAATSAYSAAERGTGKLKTELGNQQTQWDQRTQETLNTQKAEQEKSKDSIKTGGEAVTDYTSDMLPEMMQRALDPSAYGGRRYERDDMLNQRSYRDTLNLSRLTDKLNNRLYYRPGQVLASIGTSGGTVTAYGGNGASVYQGPQIDTEERRNMELRRRLEQQRITNEQELQYSAQKTPIEQLQQYTGDILALNKQFAQGNPAYIQQMNTLWSNNMIGAFNAIRGLINSVASNNSTGNFKEVIAQQLPNVGLNNEVLASMLEDVYGIRHAGREDILNEKAARKAMEAALREANGNEGQAYALYNKYMLALGNIMLSMSARYGMQGTLSSLYALGGTSNPAKYIAKDVKEFSNMQDMWGFGDQTNTNTAAGLRAQ